MVREVVEGMAGANMLYLFIEEGNLDRVNLAFRCNTAQDNISKGSASLPVKFGMLGRNMRGWAFVGRTSRCGGRKGQVKEAVPCHVKPLSSPPDMS